MNQNRSEFNLGSALFQNVFGLIRVWLVILTLFFFASNFSAHFHQISPLELEQSYRASNPVFAHSPDWLVIFVASITNPYIIRYAIAPLAAIICIILAGTFYVKDVYALYSFTTALHYVLASLFAVAYPELRIDKGVKQLKKGETNLIEAIGGPGSVLVEPGSAAIFRQLREPTSTIISATYFLGPFETIAHTVDLDEQQGDKDEITSLTRDGIRVRLTDVHFRYRLKTEPENGFPARRSVKTPYPFVASALESMTYNLQVTKDGQDKWSAAIERPVVGVIMDYIAAHTIDYLTAPREGDCDPRSDIMADILRKAKAPLENVGAELLWIDIGHLEIIKDEDKVDHQRASSWAVDWVGDATVARAYGEAKRQAYQEMGRAEAQAEMILGIADALRDINLSGHNTADNVRRILLARTAQLLDSISQSKSQEGG